MKAVEATVVAAEGSTNFEFVAEAFEFAAKPATGFAAETVLAAVESLIAHQPLDLDSAAVAVGVVDTVASLIDAAVAFGKTFVAEPSIADAVLAVDSVLELETQKEVAFVEEPLHLELLAGLETTVESSLIVSLEQLSRELLHLLVCFDSLLAR